MGLSHLGVELVGPTVIEKEFGRSPLDMAGPTVWLKINEELTLIRRGNLLTLIDMVNFSEGFR